MSPAGDPQADARFHRHRSMGRLQEGHQELRRAHAQLPGHTNWPNHGSATCWTLLTYLSGPQATLKLTPEQVQTVVAARDAFKKGIKNCAERRRSCLGTLAVAPGERLDCVNSEGRLSELFVQEVEAADKAKATVMEEHKLRDDLAHAFRKVSEHLNEYCGQLLRC